MPRKKPLPHVDPYDPSKYAIKRLISEINSLTKIIKCDSCDKLNGMGAIIPDMHQILINLGLHKSEEDLYKTIIHEMLHILLPELEEIETEALTQILACNKTLIKKLKASYLPIFLEFDKRR